MNDSLKAASAACLLELALCSAALAQAAVGAAPTAVPNKPVVVDASRPATPAPSIARADELFAEGKAHLAAQDFARACAAFTRSYNLRLATGTLLALAMCHEASGKLATAAGQYRGVVVRAGKEGRPDRAAAALERANALAPTLSSLTIQRDAPLGDLMLYLDGTPLVAGQIGIELPLDGGEHVVEAMRRDDVLWSTRVTLATSKDHQRVIVPPLNVPRALITAAPVATPDRAARARDDAGRDAEPQRSAEEGLTTGQWAGLVTMGAAVISLGIGTAFALSAMSLNADSALGCDGDLCTAEARQQRLDARFAGDAATVAFLSGATLATVGAVLFFAHPRRPSRVDTASSAELEAWASSDGAGARVLGRF